jgi:chemotaxis methyl-accepting protein methylase
VRALNLARLDPRFHLGEQNILEPLATPEPPHIVRAMNVLNATYFTQEDLSRILGNFHTALRTGGWLVTGYNEDAGSQVHGAIFRKTDAGFERLWESGRGPQMQDRILAWVPSRS